MINSEFDGGYQGLGTSPGKELPHTIDGLFYRGDIEIDREALVARLTSSPDATVLDYQNWVDGAWKQEQGTLGALERFTSKLHEETAELRTEVLSVFLGQGDGDQNSARLLDEAGDLIWSISALACCASADIDAGIKGLLYDYVRGSRYITVSKDGAKTEPPIWRPTAGSLVIKWDQLTLDDIDTLIESGFEPTASTKMFIERDEDDDTPIGHMMLLENINLTIENLILAQYGGPGTQNRQYMLEESFKDKSIEIGKLVAFGYLSCAFILNRAIQRTLADAIKHNVEKVSKRVETGTVDKSDGPREA